MEDERDDMDALVATTIEIDGAPDGPLTDMTFVAKDLFAIRGHVSSFGHASWRDTHSAGAATAPTIERMLSAGADLVGLTKMDQLAYSLIGNVGEGDPPRNALAPELFCGGSSSGSASALAAGLAEIGLGTDTAGSIRVPAAACGLHGLRPSHGVIDTEGVTPLAATFDVVGILSRQVKPMRRVLDVLAPMLRARPNIESIRYGADVFAGVDAETQQVARGFAERLAQDTGATLGDTEFGRFTSPDVGDLFARLQGREIWATHGGWVDDHGEHLAPDVRTRLDRCKRLASDSVAVHHGDEMARQGYRADFHDSVPSGTVVVLPVMAEHGPFRSWDDARLAAFRVDCFRLTAPSSLTGAPQAVVPVRNEREDRAIGIGLLTAPGDDLALIELLSES